MPDFIQTEEFGSPGESGEKVVWEAVKAAFASQDTLAFWKYPNFADGFREPDILILDPELGVVVIEVKSLPLGQIKRMSGYSWELNKPYFGQNSINPHEQAKVQLNKMLKQIRNRPALSRVPGRVLVAVPLITRDEWEEASFNTLVSSTPLLFGDQLTPAKLRRAIENTPLIAQGGLLDDRQWAELKRCFSTSGEIKNAAPEAQERADQLITEAKQARAAVEPAPPSNLFTSALSRLFHQPVPRAALPQRPRGELLQILRDASSQFDLQQEKISKTIPAGPQRIRGLAGSGKTVLLAQKAASMHLKHPDWDIAFVFWSRSLYDQILKWIDLWLRKQSGGEVTLRDAAHKIRVLHAWGADEQPGFYRLLADNVGVEPLSPGKIPKRFAYTRGLLYAARQLLEQAEERQLDLSFFDAVLIDEGQDLVSEDPELQYEGRQAFYWLAYQSLRPIPASAPGEVSHGRRRLIWAYDEAQSLDSLMIPNNQAIFGEHWQEALGAGPTYAGGIGKSEVMRVCYRVPGPTLVAAHALGMGLLRKEGMLSGPTTQEDWKNLGYKVEGDFRKKDLIVLSRDAEHSPHPLPILTNEPLISFSSHDTIEQEAEAVVARIKADIAQGLAPSRNILVIHLGVKGVLSALHKAFKDSGLHYYAAGRPKPNQVYGKGNANDFWMSDCVTVSGIHQVKGNEAESVYVVGVHKLLEGEDDVQLRNHLFVAMSRSKGWVHLSGVGVAGTRLGAEIEEVIRQGMTLEFYPGTPKRTLNDQDLFAAAQG